MPVGEDVLVSCSSCIVGFVAAADYSTNVHVCHCALLLLLAGKEAQAKLKAQKKHATLMF